MVVVDILKDHATAIPLGSKSVMFKHIPVKIFDQHRTAFYHWANWSIENKNRPNLITFDYHNDREGTVDISEALDDFFQSHEKTALAISYATSFILDSSNDSQIAVALEYNYIDKVFALQTKDSEGILNVHDSYKGHEVFATWEMKNFFDDILHNNILDNNKIYIDIDLDYFITNENDTPNTIKLKPEEEIIREITSIKNHVLQNPNYQICGITIAMEPACCGSIKNSTNILKLRTSIKADVP
jgi:hypothetical protein